MSMPGMSLIRLLMGLFLGRKRTEEALGSLHHFLRHSRYMLNPLYRENARKLREFRDKHSGKRCFIIGNGPSLKGMDLSPLKNEYTFGLNRIYLLFDKLGFETTYYVAVNQLVMEQCGKEIDKLSCPKFVRWEFKDLAGPSGDYIFLTGRSGPKFSKELSSEGVWDGATVTYVAMQLAYYMGFAEAVLIGVDHRFSTQGKPHALVVSREDDANHFSKDYFGKGFRWQLPDLQTSELAYGLAKDVFEKSGRKIIDATVNGNLDIFPKADFGDLTRARH